MKRLHNPQDAAQWLRTQVRGVLHTDSRRVGAGDGFIAWPGGVTDGRQFVTSALKQGATACVVELAGADAFAWGENPAIATYDGLKAASGLIAAAYYEQPSQALDVVAITGTNGKTSTAWWLAHALHNAGKRCAMVGTLGVGEVAHLEVTGMTTPDPVLLQAKLRGMVDAGVNACAIEASSIGLAEHRLDGTQVRVAMFTNFTQDHLDYHGDMASYWQAKLALFSWAGLQAAVVNADDAQGTALAAQLQARGDLSVWTMSCGLHSSSDAVTCESASAQHIVARDIQHGAMGLCFDVVEGDDVHALDTQLVGHYNVSNVLGVIACMRALGYSLADAVQACRVLPAVPGRMQTVGVACEPLVVIDYAHTPDAVAQAVQALLPLAQSRGGELTCVLGCGGDRDAAKRSLMAAAAEQYAQHVVLTSDNPRSEDPQTILNQMLTGLHNAAKAIVIADRAQAIAQTVQHARAQDVVLVAGKGHEDYQEILGVKHPFSDVQHAREALAQRAEKGRRMSDMNLSLKQISQWLKSSQLHGDGGLTIQRVNTDSRTCQAGDLFVALKGERFDANDFLPQVAASGATAALAERCLDAAKLAGVQVPDTRVALGQLAKGWRSQFNLPVIAVTGSNGKTTVTQMIASILRAGFGDDALATQGNLNNDIGVPQTLLRMRAHHRSAVVELGMNHPGEIAGLADMTQASVALVNNAQREHQEYMATVEAVAQENGEAIKALPAHGVAVFPAHDEYSPLWKTLAGKRACMRFSMSANSDDKAEVQLLKADWLSDHWAVEAQTPAGVLHTQLHIAGRHNVGNALAATACALAAGVSLSVIEQGLNSFEPVKGRSRAFGIRCQGRDITVVDDTYNANPDSVRAAIDVLVELPAPRLLVLGDMGEVGTQGPEFHQEVGLHAAQMGIDHVLCLGDLAAHTASACGANAHHMTDIDALNQRVMQQLPKLGSVLVKGSRFMKMERVIEAINACHDHNKKETTPCC